MIDYLRKCRYCGHAEAHHGPISGRTSDNRPIPGRLCFFAENAGFSEDLCPCSGFNTTPWMTFWDAVVAKLQGTTKERQSAQFAKGDTA